MTLSKGSAVPEILRSTNPYFIANSSISRASRAGGATYYIFTRMTISRDGKNEPEESIFVLHKIKLLHVIVIDGLVLLLLSKSALYIYIYLSYNIRIL